MSLKVMIVDDDAAVRYYHEIIVTSSGLSAAPLHFKNGAEALSYLQNEYSSLTKYLMLLDINMPVLGGWGLLDKIQDEEEYQQVYVAMSTSSVNATDKERSRLYSRVIAFFEKPITVEDCKEMMANAPFAVLFKGFVLSLFSVIL